MDPAQSSHNKTYVEAFGFLLGTFRVSFLEFNWLVVPQLENLCKANIRFVAWPLQRLMLFSARADWNIYVGKLLSHILVSISVKWSPCFCFGKKDFDSFNTHNNSSKQVQLTEFSAVCRQKWSNTDTPPQKNTQSQILDMRHTFFSYFSAAFHADI